MDIFYPPFVREIRYEYEHLLALFGFCSLSKMGPSNFEVKTFYIGNEQRVSVYQLLRDSIGKKLNVDDVECIIRDFRTKFREMYNVPGKRNRRRVHAIVYRWSSVGDIHSIEYGMCTFYDRSGFEQYRKKDSINSYPTIRDQTYHIFVIRMWATSSETCAGCNPTTCHGAFKPMKPDPNHWDPGCTHPSSARRWLVSNPNPKYSCESHGPTAHTSYVGSPECLL